MILNLHMYVGSDIGTLIYTSHNYFENEHKTDIKANAFQIIVIIETVANFF